MSANSQRPVFSRLPKELGLAEGQEWYSLAVMCSLVLSLPACESHGHDAEGMLARVEHVASKGKTNLTPHAVEIRVRGSEHTPSLVKRLDVHTPRWEQVTVGIGPLSDDGQSSHSSVSVSSMSEFCSTLLRLIYPDVWPVTDGRHDEYHLCSWWVQWHKARHSCCKWDSAESTWILDWPHVVKQHLKLEHWTVEAARQALEDAFSSEGARRPGTVILDHLASAMISESCAQARRKIIEIPWRVVHLDPEQVQAVLNVVPIELRSDITEMLCKNSQDHLGSLFKRLEDLPVFVGTKRGLAGNPSLPMELPARILGCEVQGSSVIQLERRIELLLLLTNIQSIDACPRLHGLLCSEVSEVQLRATFTQLQRLAKPLTWAFDGEQKRFLARDGAR